MRFYHIIESMNKITIILQSHIIVIQSFVLIPNLEN